MPANLTPEYKAAEAAFRKARDPGERLECLREMLRVIPKHKGTDHLTGSGAPAAPYPFTTQYPEPGMMPYEDIAFQLLDLPAVSPEHPVPWLASTLGTADACLLVVDLTDPACVEQIEAVHAVLGERRVMLTDRWTPAGDSAGPARARDGDPFAVELPTLLLANKADRLADADAELQALLELTGLRYPAVAVSATTGGASGRSAPGSSPISTSCASTRRCRAARPTDGDVVELHA